MKILKMKQSVDVVPVGISYRNEKNSLGSVDLGKTITIENKEKSLYSLCDGEWTEKLGDFDNKNTLDNLVEILKKKLSDCVAQSRKV